MKHAQSTSVRELIQKIENHPDRHALQQDLRQNQAFHPFSPELKKMIQEVGNIGLFELLETDPKTQCTACLSYWNVALTIAHAGISCRKKQRPIEVSLNIRWTFFSLPEYVIKKGRPHGHRYGKKARRQRMLSGQPLKEEMQKEKVQGIYDRFLRDHEFHVRMIEKQSR